MRAQRTGPAVLRPIGALTLRLPVTQRIGPAVLRPIRALTLWLPNFVSLCAKSHETVNCLEASDHTQVQEPGQWQQRDYKGI